MTNIHNIEIDEYLENCFYNITNRLALGINVEPQYLKFTEPVDARGYYEDVFNYFNFDPIEIIDDTDDTNDTDDSNKENEDQYITELNLKLEKYFDTRKSLGLQFYD